MEHRQRKDEDFSTDFALLAIARTFLISDEFFQDGCQFSTTERLRRRPTSEIRLCDTVTVFLRSSGPFVAFDRNWSEEGSLPRNYFYTELDYFLAILNEPPKTDLPPSLPPQDPSLVLSHDRERIRPNGSASRKQRSRANRTHRGIYSGGGRERWGGGWTDERGGGRELTVASTTDCQPTRSLVAVQFQRVVPEGDYIDLSLSTRRKKDRSRSKSFDGAHAYATHSAAH